VNPDPIAVPVTPQTVTMRHALAYTGIILATVLLGSFGQQLAAGLVPIPKEWSWLTPVLLAGIVSLTTLLPRVTDTAANSLVQAASVTVSPSPVPPAPAPPTQHVVTLQLANAPAAPSAKVIDVATTLPPAVAPPSPAPEPAAPAAPPA
jgi:hypothetical protein